MSTELAELKERVAALEREVAALMAAPLRSPKTDPAGWVATAFPAVRDEEAAEEAYRLGREWRESYRDDPESRLK